MLDVTRLRVLVAVARCGSVTAAARALNYAQPSVSHHLARLEAETGTKLIQRAGRGIRLTDAGRLLAERAAEVIGRLDAAENELAAYTGLRAGRLRLAAFPSALGTIVPAAAAMLREHQPGVDLRLTEAEPPEALRMLRAGYVDVALVFRYSPDVPGADGPDAREPGSPDGCGESRGQARHEPARRRGRRHRPYRGPARTAAPRRAGAPGDLRPGHRGTIGRPGRLRPPPLDRGLRPLPGQPAQAVRARRVHPEDRVHHRQLRRRPGAGGSRPGGFDPAGALPARRTASRDQDRAAPGRPQVRVRGAVRRPARPARGEPAPGGARHGRRAAAAPPTAPLSYSRLREPGPAAPRRARPPDPGEPEAIPGQLTLPGMPSPAEAAPGSPRCPAWSSPRRTARGDGRR